MADCISKHYVFIGGRITPDTVKTLERLMTDDTPHCITFHGDIRPDGLTDNEAVMKTDGKDKLYFRNRQLHYDTVDSEGRTLDERIKAGVSSAPPYDLHVTDRASGLKLIFKALPGEEFGGGSYLSHSEFRNYPENLPKRGERLPD